MKKIINRGFTLIELLVVIAIIGILASIVLVSLNSARQKGKDTRIISDVKEIQTQIETEASSGGLYQTGATLCVAANVAAVGGDITPNASSVNCNQLSSDATANGGSTKIRTDTAAPTTGFKAYAVYSALNSAGTSFCVDSTGKVGTTPAANGYTCS